MHQSAVRRELARGAPGVGEDGEWAYRVGAGVEHHGMRTAVMLEGAVVRVVAAVATGEIDLGQADVGAVEEDRGVVVRDRRVHGRDSGVVQQELPCACAP